MLCDEYLPYRIEHGLIYHQSHMYSFSFRSILIFYFFLIQRFEAGKDGHLRPSSYTCKPALLNWRPQATSNYIPKDSEQSKIFTTFYKFLTTVESKTLTFPLQKLSLWPNTTNSSLNCSGCRKTIFSMHLRGTSTMCSARSTIRV